MTALAIEGEGALADLLRGELDRRGPRAGAEGLIFIADENVDACCTRVRRCQAPAIVVLVPDSLPPLGRQLLIAAIAPLAVELAPTQRVCALEVSANAELADITEAALFLLTAQAVTGQVLAVTARG